LKAVYRAFAALFLLGACNSAPKQSARLNATHVPSADTQGIPDRSADIDTTITFIQSGPRCDCEVIDSNLILSADSSVLPGDTGNISEDNVAMEATASTIQLDFLNKIPDQIDGCSGFYTYDSISLQQQRYLFASNLQELAFVKVNGRQIMLKRIKEESLPKEAHRDTYEGDGYRVILHIKATKRTGDELFYDAGTLEVWQGEKKITVKIHGESGC
jgi:hypothetical protein